MRPQILNFIGFAHVQVWVGQMRQHFIAHGHQNVQIIKREQAQVITAQMATQRLLKRLLKKGRHLFKSGGVHSLLSVKSGVSSGFSTDA